MLGEQGRVLLDDVQLVDDAQVHERPEVPGVEEPFLSGEPVVHGGGGGQVGPRTVAVATAVQVDELLGLRADDGLERPPVGPRDQGQIETVGAVRRVGEAGELHVWGGAGVREALLHPAQVGVERAARMLDRLGAVVTQERPRRAVEAHVCDGSPVTRRAGRGGAGT